MKTKVVSIRDNLSNPMTAIWIQRFHHTRKGLLIVTWWRHQMETFSALLALCAGIHRSPVNSFHKGQWRGALVFSLICAWINGLRRHGAHCDVIVMVRWSHDPVTFMMRFTGKLSLYWNGSLIFNLTFTKCLLHGHIFALYMFAMYRAVCDSPVSQLVPV